MPKKQQGQRATVDTNHLSALAVGVALLFSITAAHAEDASSASGSTGSELSKMFSISGFGSVGVTHSSIRSADYPGGFLQPKGPGASSAYSFTDMSRFGLQLNGQFTNQLSAVVQILAQENWDHTFTPGIEWANLKYAFTPDFSVRVGRIALPGFFAGDYRNVGYANTWANVPLETYNLMPVTKNDGVDMSYSMHFGDVDNTTQVLYGKSIAHVPITTPASQVNSSNSLGFFNTTSKGPLTVRAGYLQSHLKFNHAVNFPQKLFNFGAAYDPGQWLIQAEWSRSTIDKLTPGYSSWYVLGGYRIQKFTPYAMYSTVRSFGSSTFAPTTNQGSKDYAIGVRWDFAKNMDLKVQYDRVVLPKNSSGYFINANKDFAQGSSANLVRVVLDYVF